MDTVAHHAEGIRESLLNSILAHYGIYRENEPFHLWLPAPLKTQTHSISSPLLSCHLPEVGAFPFPSVRNPRVWTHVVALRYTHLRHWQGEGGREGGKEKNKINKNKMSNLYLMMWWEKLRLYTINAIFSRIKHARRSLSQMSLAFM